MALTSCDECGHKISERAAACPSCGCPSSSFSDVGRESIDPRVGGHTPTRPRNPTGHLATKFGWRWVPLIGALIATFVLCLPLLAFVCGFSLGIFKFGAYLAVATVACDFFLLSRLSDWPSASRTATTFSDGLRVGAKLAAAIYVCALLASLRPWIEQHLPQDPVPLPEQ
jgi:hypothetical protein